MTATTALTAQNTQGVKDIFVTPTSFVRKQIEACVDDVGVDVIKTGALSLISSTYASLTRKNKGMLASIDTVKMVSEVLGQSHGVVSVVDPVGVNPRPFLLLPL